MSGFAAGRFHHVSPAIASWLDAAADGLDVGARAPSELLPVLAEGGLTRVGVPEVFGGDGGDTNDAIEAIAEVSALSLAAGFVLWGHRTYIEYLLQSPNSALREKLLPDLLNGRTAGATGLSNAMKFLAGLEELQIVARPEDGAWVVNGKMPWVTNLRIEGFHVAAAVAVSDGSPIIASFASSDDGIARSPDLDLFGLRSTNTAAIGVTNARLLPGHVLSGDAVRWLPQVRPAFLGLQCGMSIGLARRAIYEAKSSSGAGRGALSATLGTVSTSLNDQKRALVEGVRDGVFRTAPADLFRIRIALAEIVASTVSQATGGRAYVSPSGQGFARRWREAAFIPIVTPSIVQLRTVLDAQATRQTASA